MTDDFGYGSPYADDEEYNPSLDPAYLQMMMQYLMGAGGPMMPSMNPAQVDTLYGAVPGSLNPTQQGNYLQDYLSIMLDPAVAAMGGSGAYGSDAFAPTANYTPVPTPGRDQLLRYTQMPGTIEAYVAEQILSGGSASSALGELQQAFEANPEDPEVAGLVQQLPMTQESGAWETDWAGASQNFLAMQQTYMSDPTPGTTGPILDPETGEVIAPGEEIVQMMDAAGNPVLVRVEQEASPAAEWYRERGLSLPTDQYTPEDLMGPEWAQGQARVMEALDEYEREQAEFEAVGQNIEGNEQRTVEDEAFARAVMEQAIQSGYRPEGMEGPPTFGSESSGNVQRPMGAPTSAVSAAVNYEPSQYDPLSSAPTPEEIYGAVGEPAPTELTMPQTAEDFRAYAAEVWSQLNPAERAEMIDFAVGQGFNEQVEGGPWQQLAAELEGGGPTPARPTSNDPEDYMLGELFSDAPPESPGGAVPNPLSSTDASNVRDVREEEVPPPFSLEGLDFRNGQWVDDQGRVYGYAPSEDSQIIPTAYALWSGATQSGPRTQRPQPHSAQVEDAAGGSYSVPRPRSLNAQTSPGRSQSPYTLDTATSTRPGTPPTAGQQNQAQLRFLVDQAGGAAQQGGETRAARFRRQQTGERQTRDAAYQRYLQAAEQTYNEDFGRTMYQLYQMQQRGVTPLQQQFAARRQVPIGMGLAGGGYLPGVG